MKKFVVLLMAAALVMACCSTAFATTFTKTVQCYNEIDYKRSVDVYNTKTSSNDLKIQYNAQGCSNTESNHFRVYNKSTGNRIGAKFVEPAGKYYISCNTFQKDNTYYVDMRGNTKYHDNEGLDYIVLAGWFQLPFQYE